MCITVFISIYHRSLLIFFVKIATSISRISQSFNLYIVHFNQNDSTSTSIDHSIPATFPFLYTKKRHRNTVGRRRRRSIAIPLSLFIIHYLPFSYFMGPDKILNTRIHVLGAEHGATCHEYIHACVAYIFYICESYARRLSLFQTYSRRPSSFRQASLLSLKQTV